MDPTMPPTPPRAAYLHIPLCIHRCGYCNFAVVAGRDDLAQPLLEALARELSALGAPREVDTLYFGGGTPTQLTYDLLDELATLSTTWHPLAPQAEWTVEANPEDVSHRTWELLARHGVTRVSLGAQSLQADKLRVLERRHTPQQVADAVQMARAAGLQVGIDLIFAVPGESLSDWQRDLEAALALAPDHLSTYGLTFEKGTAFWGRRQRGELTEVDEDAQLAMYECAIDRLIAAGYEHYEVSNFALPGRRSRHNQVYWRGDEYYAAGPGAARYVGGVRETNHRSTTTYLRRIASGQSPVAESETLSPRDRAAECLVLGLRRIEGVDCQQFECRTGWSPWELAGDAIDRFVDRGLLERTQTHLRLTRSGLLVSDAVWPELL
jgi:oxygen-independent coproporphyrinogen-3 oxidase